MDLDVNVLILIVWPCVLIYLLYFIIVVRKLKQVKKAFAP